MPAGDQHRTSSRSSRKASSPLFIMTRHASRPELPEHETLPDRKPQNKPLHDIPYHLSERPLAQPRLRRPLSRLQQTHLLSPPSRFPFRPPRGNFPLNHLSPLVPLSERATSQPPVSRRAHKSKPESFQVQLSERRGSGLFASPLASVLKEYTIELAAA
jgi:hypothetical protein